MIPKKASSLYKEVSEDLLVEQTLVEDCIEFYYKEIRQHLTNLTYPRVNVPGLGQFVIKKTGIQQKQELKQSLWTKILKTSSNFRHLLNQPTNLKHYKSTQPQICKIKT